MIGSKQYSDFALPVFDDDRHEVLVLELEEEIVAGYDVNLLDARLFDNVPTIFPDWDHGIYAYGM